MRILKLFSAGILILAALRSGAQDVFNLEISDKALVLTHLNAEYSVPLNSNFIIRIKDHGSLQTITRNPKPFPETQNGVFRVSGRTSVRVLQDNDDVKSVEIPLTFSYKLDDKIEFSAILTLMKESPALFTRYKIDNQSEKNLFFEFFCNILTPTGGLSSFMMDYDSTIKFPVQKKSGTRNVNETIWKLALGTNDKGVGVALDYKGSGAYTFRHPKYFKINYLGLRNVFGVKSGTTEFVAKLILLPADTHKEAKEIYEKSAKLKKEVDSLIPNEGAAGKRDGLNPFRTKNVMRIKKLSKAPIIDGVIDDLYGEDAKTPVFRLSSNNGTATQDTYAYFSYDDDNFYFAVVCTEDQMDKLQVVKDMPWKGDSVELYFSPDNNNIVYQIVVDSANTAFFLKLNIVKDKQKALKWDPKGVKHAVRKYSDKWIVECCVPLKAINMRADKKGVASIDCFRSWKLGRPYAQWELTAFSPTLKLNNFRATEKYGTLIFQNYPYVKDFKKRLKTLQSKFKKLIARCDDKSTVKSLESIKTKIDKIISSVPGKMTLSELFAKVDEIENLKEKFIQEIYARMPLLVWVENPMRPLKQFYLPEESRKEMKIAAFMNEYEYGALAITNLTDKAKSLRVTNTAFKNVDDPKLYIHPDSIRYREAVFVKPANTYPIPDAVPIMNEINSFTLASKQTHEVFLEINSRNLIPGTYKGELVVEELIGEFQERIPVTIKIMPVRLSDGNPFYIHYMQLYGNTHKRIELTKECRGNILSGGPYPSGVFNEKTKEHMRRLAATINAQREYGIKNYSAWTNKELNEEAFVKQLSNYKKQLAYLKTQGVTTNDFFIRHLDEPNPKLTKMIINRVKRIKSAIPGIVFAQTLGGWTTIEQAKKLASVMDVIVPYGPEGTSLVNNKDVMKVFRDHNLPVYYYCNLLPVKTTELFRVVRKTAWAIRKLQSEGLSGGGLWGFCYAGMNIVHPKLSFSMIYYNAPFDYWAQMNPFGYEPDIVMSRRMLVYRDGIEDVLGVMTLEKILNNDISLSKEEKRKLRSLVAEYDKVLSSANDIDAIYDFRCKLADALPEILPTGDDAFKDAAVSANATGNISISWTSPRLVRGRAYYRNNAFRLDPYMVKTARKFKKQVELKLYEREIGDYTFLLAGIDENGRIFFSCKRHSAIVEYMKKQR